MILSFCDRGRPAPMHRGAFCSVFSVYLKIRRFDSDKFLDDSLYYLCVLSLYMGLKRAKNGIFGYVAISTFLPIFL